MTDRELLEAAAKAARISTKVVPPFSGYDELYGFYAMNMDGTQFTSKWNPLTDDGDALRLAVKLGLRVCPVTSTGNSAYVGHDGIESVVQQHDADPYAATRRAIVRAAAAIGKEMP